MDIDFAPNTSSLGSPVTPTKLPLRGNPTLPNAPNKLIRKFSEADLQDDTPCSKHPRPSGYLDATPPEPNSLLDALEAGTKRMKITPTPSRGNERRLFYKLKDFGGSYISWLEIMAALAEKEEKEKEQESVRTHKYEELSDPGTSSSEATSTGASESESESEHDGVQFDDDEEKERGGDYDDTEDEADLTYDSEASSGSWTSSIEGTSSLASLEGDQIYTSNFRSASEAELERMETMPSLGADDEDMFADDELPY